MIVISVVYKLHFANSCCIGDEATIVHVLAVLSNKTLMWTEPGSGSVLWRKDGIRENY